MKDMSCSVRRLFCQPICLCFSAHQINATMLSCVFHGFTEDTKLDEYLYTYHPVQVPWWTLKFFTGDVYLKFFSGISNFSMEYSANDNFAEVRKWPGMLHFSPRIPAGKFFSPRLPRWLISLPRCKLAGQLAGMLHRLLRSLKTGLKSC